ncbi:MAG: damage-inducible protein DinB [Bacteroidetes bacterium]|nr:MAG: damage-inducible protein DinB [Bacteroidota bacterium]
MAQATINADDLKAQMLIDWHRAKDYTIEYLNTMPADKYGFRPVDSIRSFAEQMLHLAQSQINLISAASGREKLYGNTFILDKSETAKNKDSVVYYVKASYDFAIDAITQMDPSRLGEKIDVRNLHITRLTWFNKAFEHQTHHRGQTTIYIRLLGIKPPGEKLF